MTSHALTLSTWSSGRQALGAILTELAHGKVTEVFDVPLPDDLQQVLQETIVKADTIVAEGIGSAGLGIRLDAETLLRSIPAEDKAAATENGMVKVTVRSGERTRIVLPCSSKSAWLHLLLRPDFSEVTHPVVAFRYYCNQGPERVLLRFRPSSLVLNKQIELSPFSNDKFSLFSIRIQEGRATIAINGVVLLDCAVEDPEASGFVLDTIGTEGTTNIDIAGIWSGTGSAIPPWLSEVGFSSMVSALITMSFSKGVKELNRVLQALQKAPSNLTQDELVHMIAEIRRQPNYSELTEDLLKQRGGNNFNGIPDFPKKPEALLIVKDISVKLQSNPSEKSLKSLFVGVKSTPTTIVDNLSFKAYTGDIVGIIGKNGAGKSTLLKALVGAIPIVAGQIDAVKKPILLRPGAGMLGELTGRQNVYKTGLYMDMTIKEIDGLINDVIQFSELAEHIDRPFKYYSDGMRARLIFALATAIPRDILLLDELLSAGDAGFQKKAVERLESFMSKAKLVLVVQHTFDFVLSRCTKCLLLEHGRPVYFGDPGIATEMYRESL